MPPMFLFEAFFESIGESVAELLLEGITYLMAGAYHRLSDFFTTLFL
jgi:hypothetical protein